MNLYLFPECPTLSNGYGIIVNSDFLKLNPSNKDTIIWYTNSIENPLQREFDYVLKRPKAFNFKRFKNMLFNKVGSEVNYSEILFLKNLEFDSIFCGDVLFYRALRKLFPSKCITVRFHNCFSRIVDRKRLLKIGIDIKFSIDLQLMYALEQEIFLDKNVKKIFISEEDRAYYNLMTGENDATILGVDVDIENGISKRSIRKFDNKLIWFGGVESHKKKSVIWFVENVFPLIKAEIPSVEFHLWGNRTKDFNNPKSGIYGHGYYSGIDFPMKDNALYLNPDIIGGGVKVKLKTYLEEGISFISTPFGYEGYKFDYIDDSFCIVKDKEIWAESIIELLKK